MWKNFIVKITQNKMINEKKFLEESKRKKNFQFNVFQRITIFHSKIQTDIKL